MLSHNYLLLSLLALHATASAWSSCPPSGPLFPRPTALSNSSGFSVENTSFSLGIVSHDSSKPLWEYYHRGAADNGTFTINGDTQYLIGTGIDLDTPITENLPRLADTSSAVEWENINLASLADHLSGITPSYGFSEFYYLQPLLEHLEFPAFDLEELAECGITGLNGPCSQDQLLEGMQTVQPITQSDTRPVYSQLSFPLLSYALSAIYNLTYPELIEEHIVKPFNVTNTGLSTGNCSLAAIPPVENSLGAEYSDNAPGGGLYSSLNDLAMISHAILNRTALTSAADIRRPWEIFRSQNLTPKYPHTIDIHGKNGGAYGYTAQLSLIDADGTGVVVLTAGPPQAWTKLYDAMLSALPTVEEEAQLQAQQCTGNFISSDGLVHMTLSIDDGPGLRLSTLSRNNSDLLTGILQIYTQALPQFGNLSTNFRIFPTDISEAANLTLQDNSTVQVSKEDWRNNLDFEPNTEENSGSGLPGQAAREEECTSWQTADWLYCGGQAVDRLVVQRDQDGVVRGWEVPFLRVLLKRDK
ncbi:beta-lactamase/transpeptidase-like protein [Setomelanomma holmii]|uniref:Beta-lactamase/transpeptidase-like protein n=1 Tax=Setomelanomma holmii TaxID=210430 RepID=A0A9P4LH35_9PLEO|nr:beta-lactamase/transpeptidase-like protein [Setomelanomma holmii]